jgi:hypothetical protein
VASRFRKSYKDCLKDEGAKSYEMQRSSQIYVTAQTAKMAATLTERTERKNENVLGEDKFEF